jgi:hypothetical protein
VSCLADVSGFKSPTKFASSSYPYSLGYLDSPAPYTPNSYSCHNVADPTNAPFCHPPASTPFPPGLSLSASSRPTSANGRFLPGDANREINILRTQIGPSVFNVISSTHRNTPSATTAFSRLGFNYELLLALHRGRWKDPMLHQCWALLSHRGKKDSSRTKQEGRQFQAEWVWRTIHA